MRRLSRSALTRLVGSVAAGLTLALAAACASGPGATWHGPGDARASGAPASPSVDPGAAITVVPAADATAVSVTDPVTVTIDSGTLNTVSVINEAGKQVQGAFDTGKRSWRTIERLGYGKSHTVTVNGTTADGKAAQKTTKFSTLKPKAMAMAYLRANGSHLLKERTTYGVGQPIIVYLDKAVTNKTAVEQALTVTADPPVVGRWHWFDAHELHYRPAAYWKPGTKVTVKTALYGKNLGDDVYGGDDAAASFTIGQSKIAIADNNTHHMLVYFDGQLVRDIPVSMGMGGTAKTPTGNTVNYWTSAGAHVVIEKTPVTHMSSKPMGYTDPNDKKNYYDEDVKLTVRISYSGEFVHMADWNISSHGRANTSHGCINVGPANAQWFYDNFSTGDVVDVKNTPRQLDVRNGLGDWLIPWSQW
jgi:lipoprotein-anchoring transpeptidase ErfK/SrfK